MEKQREELARHEDELLQRLTASSAKLPAGIVSNNSKIEETRLALLVATEKSKESTLRYEKELIEIRQLLQSVISNETEANERIEEAIRHIDEQGTAPAAKFSPLKEALLEMKTDASNLNDVKVELFKILRDHRKLHGRHENVFAAMDLNFQFHGFSATILNKDVISLCDLQEYGMSAREARELGYSLPELREAGYELSVVLKETDCNLFDLRGAGYTCHDFIKAGLGLDVVRSVCFIRCAGVLRGHEKLCAITCMRR